MAKFIKNIILYSVIAGLTASPLHCYGQEISLPEPGKMVLLSRPYKPATLIGIKIFANNPLRFDFIVDIGDAKLDKNQLKNQSAKLIRYFLAALTSPEDDLWVNLSPYEQNRIAPNLFSQTEIGRDLLAQDYLLKQLTASLLHPDGKQGKLFWQEVYRQTEQKYGTARIAVDTFNKVWVMPKTAGIYTKTDTAIIVDSDLRVMTEQDYLALENKKINKNGAAEISSQAFKKIILPVIEQEVNRGETFSPLRQIYTAVILAKWFRQNLKQTLLGQSYAGRNKINGIGINDKKVREKIYRRYLEAFKKGVFKIVKAERESSDRRRARRTYFSGGASLIKVELTERNAAQARQVLADDSKIIVISSAVKVQAVNADLSGTEDWVIEGNTGDIQAKIYRYPTDPSVPAKHEEITGLQKRVIIPLADGRTMFIGDHHNYALPFWWLMMRQGILAEKGNRILHIDAHPDATFPRRYKPENDPFRTGTGSLAQIEQHSKNILGIEGFIAPYAENGFISDWYWFYNVDSDRAVRMLPEKKFTYEAYEEKTPLEELEFDILDIDLDVLHGYPAKEIDSHLDRFARLAKKAKVISIVTSPDFIGQKEAIDYARRLAEKIKASSSGIDKPEAGMPNPEGGINIKSANINLKVSGEKITAGPAVSGKPVTINGLKPFIKKIRFLAKPDVLIEQPTGRP